MRFAVVAAVLGLLGCAAGGSDPGQVVAGLTQQQADQTQWLFNAQTNDLVAAEDLMGPADGYAVVRVRLFDNGVLIWNPATVGDVQVQRDGSVRPGGGGENPDGIAPEPQGGFSPNSEFAPDFGGLNPTRPENGFERFDEDLLPLLGSDERFFVFHPGCA